MLAGRVQGGKVRGSITVNDIPKDRLPRAKWSRINSYIMQVRLVGSRTRYSR
jgi:hypothetical protein